MRGGSKCEALQAVSCLPLALRWWGASLKWSWVVARWLQRASRSLGSETQAGLLSQFLHPEHTQQAPHVILDKLMVVARGLLLPWLVEGVDPDVHGQSKLSLPLLQGHYFV